MEKRKLLSKHEKDPKRTELVTKGRLGGKKKVKNNQVLFSIFLFFSEAQILVDSQYVGKLLPANKLNAGPCWLRKLTIVWIVVC